MKSATVIGIIYNPRAPKAVSMGRDLYNALSPTRRCWVESAANENISDEVLKETDLIITVGGDGTILRSARIAVPHKVPILGINMGRLGFMTELRAKTAFDRLTAYLEGSGWLEERSMLQAQVVTHASLSKVTTNSTSYHALNDIVLGRGAAARLITVKASVDGADLTSYRSDAVIICTATGSTGYNLSAGGPILHPQADEMILKPVAPHVGLATAMVLPSSSTIVLTVESDDSAILSVDGYQDLIVEQGHAIKIQSSPDKALFLREGSPEDFYANLTRRLGFDAGQGSGRAVFY